MPVERAPKEQKNPPTRTRQAHTHSSRPAAGLDTSALLQYKLYVWDSIFLELSQTEFDLIDAK